MHSQAKHVANLFFTVLLAGGLTLTACSSNQQASAPEEPQETVSVEVIGPDANDKDADYVAKTDYALADVEHGPPGRCMRGASWAIWQAHSPSLGPWIAHGWCMRGDLPRGSCMEAFSTAGMSWGS